MWLGVHKTRYGNEACAVLVTGTSSVAQLPYLNNLGHFNKVSNQSMNQNITHDTCLQLLFILGDQGFPKRSYIAQDTSTSYGAQLP